MSHDEDGMGLHTERGLLDSTLPVVALTGSTRGNGATSMALGIIFLKHDGLLLLRRLIAVVGFVLEKVW